MYRMVQELMKKKLFLNSDPNQVARSLYTFSIFLLFPSVIIFHNAQQYIL
jgi:hypothetical protein